MPKTGFQRQRAAPLNTVNQKSLVEAGCPVMIDFQVLKICEGKKGLMGNLWGSGILLGQGLMFQLADLVKRF